MSAGPSAMPAIAAAAMPVPAMYVRSATARAEMPSVSPRGELGTKRRADTNKLEPVGQIRETDVIGRDANVRAAKRPLAILRSPPSAPRAARGSSGRSGGTRPTAGPSPNRTRDGARPGSARSSRSSRDRCAEETRRVHAGTCAEWTRASASGLSQRLRFYNSAHDVTLCSAPSALLQQVPYQGATTPPSGDTADTGSSASHYTIVATLDEAQAKLHARGTLVYVNNSPDTLREMYRPPIPQRVSAGLQVERGGRARAPRPIPEPQRAELRLRAIHAGADREWHAGRRRLSRRAGQHGRAFPPADAARAARFRPRRRSSGTPGRRPCLGARAAKDGHSTLRNGIPKVAVYDRGGWEPNALVPAGELYGEYGTYDVTMVVRDDQVLASTGVPVSGDPGWARVSRTRAAAPQRARRMRRSPRRRRRPCRRDTTPCGSSPKTCIISPGARRRTIATRAASTSRARSARALSDVGHRRRARALQSRRRHDVGRRPRRRAHDLRAAVAGVDLGAVRVSADDERASPRSRRHRVPDDDHGRVGVAGAHPSRGRPRLHLRNPRQQRVAVGMDGRRADRLSDRLGAEAHAAGARGQCAGAAAACRRAIA